MSKSSKIACAFGIVLLLVMAAFHGSGFFFVSEAITSSNAEPFLKDIVPVLFAHPSIHLLVLAGFGVLAFFLSRDARKLLVLIGIAVFADAGLGFYLGGMIPGSMLSAAALCVVFAALGRDRD